MGPVEIIALAFAVLVAAKILVILIKPRLWYVLVVRKLGFFESRMMPILVLVMAALVLWFLLEEMSIVQVFAAGVFTWLLVTLWVLTYSRELAPVVRGAYYDPRMRMRNLVNILLYLALCVWVGFVLFLT